jgi:hypothetical protein
MKKIEAIIQPHKLEDVKVGWPPDVRQPVKTLVTVR